MHISRDQGAMTSTAAAAGSDARRLLPGRQNSHQMDRINGKSQKSATQNRSLHSLVEQRISRRPRRLSPRKQCLKDSALKETQAL